MKHAGYDRAHFGWLYWVTVVAFAVGTSPSFLGVLCWCIGTALTYCLSLVARLDRE